jgi:hypothetical protein
MLPNHPCAAGTPLWEGSKARDRGTAYRFHLADPVSFNKSLKVEIEHKGAQNFPDGTANGFIERDDLMSSVALWYQIEPHKQWPALPLGSDRLPFREESLVKGWQAVKDARHSGQPIWVQPNKRVATDGKHLLFAPTNDTGWVEIRFQLEQELNAGLWAKTIHSDKGGKYRVSLDGAKAGVVDVYGDFPVAMLQRLGTHKLAAGEHVLRFECIGKSANSEGYNLGFDSLVVRKYAYSRPAYFDLRTIQVKK